MPRATLRLLTISHGTTHARQGSNGLNNLGAIMTFVTIFAVIGTLVAGPVGFLLGAILAVLILNS